MARIRTDRWPVPGIFRLLQRLGAVAPAEMFRTFNMGIGYVLVVAAADADRVVETLRARRERAYVLGEIERARRGAAPGVVLESPRGAR